MIGCQAIRMIVAVQNKAKDFYPVFHFEIIKFYFIFLFKTQGMEQSFAKLLRSSRFANFQRDLGQIIQHSPHSPSNYGLKRDLKLKKPAAAIRIVNLDEEMNQTEFTDASFEKDRVNLLEELVKRSGNDAAKSVTWKSKESQRALPGAYQSLQQELVVAGRILGKHHKGFLVGVYGEVAFLSESEIPPKKYISNADIINRTVHLFRVTSVAVNSAGNSEIILSMTNVKY
jgi:hypothetical protein